MVNLPKTRNRVSRLHKVKIANRSSKKRPIPRIVLLFFSFLVFLSFGFFVFESKKSLWDGKSRINFVFNWGSLLVVSLNPQDKSAIFMPIPNNLMVDTAYGYGKYQVGALSKLETMEKRRGLVNQTIKENFNIGLDGWFSPNNDCGSIGSNDEIVSCLKSKAFSGFLKGGNETNFTRFDLLRIWWSLSKIKQKDINLFNLANYKVLKASSLADGSPIQTLNQDLLQTKIDKLFWDDQVKEESLSVKVINASFYQGAGERAAKILENSGMDVVKVENAEEEHGSCEIESLAINKNSATVKKIKNLFACSFVEINSEAETQIIVSIGRNFGH